MPSKRSTVNAADASSSHQHSGTPICEKCGNNTGLDKIDATKLNDLLESVRSRLCRDLYGNLYIKGAKSGSDLRHGQLAELFNLVATLEGIKVTMDKYIALHTPKEEPKPEKPARLNENMTATIRNIVEDVLSTPLRDLSIRCERLEQEVKKGATVPLSAGRAKSASSTKIHELEKGLEEVQEDTATLANSVRAGLGESRKSVHALTAKQVMLEAEVKYDRETAGRGLGQISAVESKISDIRDETESMSDMLLALSSRLERLENAARVGVRQTSERTAETIDAFSSESGAQGLREAELQGRTISTRVYSPERKQEQRTCKHQ